MTDPEQPNPDSILLTVDGSLPSKSAAYAATQIASAMGWRLHALYVVDVTQVFEVYSDTTRELSELGDEVLHEQQITLFEEQGTLALAEIEGLCQEMNVPVTTEMIFGGVSNIILKAARQYSLVALGRRGNRHKKNIQHLGSNFQQIAHHIHTPLLIGGSDTMQQNIQRVLLAYDGSEFSRKAFTWTENLQRMFTEVTVLSVEKESVENHTWLADRNEEIANTTLTHYEFIREEGNPGQIIASTALSKKVDLILMGANQHPKIFGWAKQSAIDTVLREIDLPVLATK